MIVIHEMTQLLTKTCPTIFKSKLDRSASEPNREQNFHFHPSSRPQLFIFSSLPVPLHACVEKICIPIPYRPFHTFRIQIIIPVNDQTHENSSHIKYRSLSRYKISKAWGNKFLPLVKLNFPLKGRSKRVSYAAPAACHLGYANRAHFLSISFENCISQHWADHLCHFYARIIDRL